MSAITKAALAGQIDRFLADRRKSSQGRWAVPTDEDMNGLYDIVSALVELKFQPDCDGDLPVDFKLRDRTRFEPDHFFLLPRDETDKTLSLALTNVKTAAEQADRIVRHREFDRQQAEEAKKKKGNT